MKQEMVARGIRATLGLGEEVNLRSSGSGGGGEHNSGWNSGCMCS